MSTLQLVSIGNVPNDGKGDSLRVAFQKINENFQNIYDRTSVGNNLDVDGNTIRALNDQGNSNIELEVSANGYIILKGKTRIEGTLELPEVPAGITPAGRVGDKKGMMFWDNNYIYICVSNFTTGGAPIWKRVPLDLWIS